jgi:predicted DsbA family dithiol-disulfide isomerase
VRHFPLHPETPPDGRSIAEMFRGREAQIQAMTQRLHELLEAEGLPYGNRSMTYNTRLAQELAAWAVARGEHRIHDALFRAYFVDAINVADPDELVRIAGEVGLPADEARRVLEEREYAPTVDRDWEQARGLGVTGVPTYIAEARGIVGAQPYELLEQLVRAAGAKPRQP